MPRTSTESVGSSSGRVRIGLDSSLGTHTGPPGRHITTGSINQSSDEEEGGEDAPLLVPTNTHISSTRSSTSASAGSLFRRACPQQEVQVGPTHEGTTLQSALGTLAVAEDGSNCSQQRQRLQYQQQQTHVRKCIGAQQRRHKQNQSSSASYHQLESKSHRDPKNEQKMTGESKTPGLDESVQEFKAREDRDPEGLNADVRVSQRIKLYK